MNQFTSGTALNPQNLIDALVEERDRLKLALEDIVKIADPPGGPRHGDCGRILTVAILALEHLVNPDGTARR